FRPLVGDVRCRCPIGSPGRAQQLQLLAHVRELARIGHPFGLDLEDGELVDQLAMGNGDRDQAHRRLQGIGTRSLAAGGSTRLPVRSRRPYHLRLPGEVAEWSNAPDSKSGLRFYRNVGSNPTLSARNEEGPPALRHFWTEWWCGRFHQVRQICLEQIWTAAGWPERKRGRGSWTSRAIPPSPPPPLANRPC